MIIDDNFDFEGAKKLKKTVADFLMDKTYVNVF